MAMRIFLAVLLLAGVSGERGGVTHQELNGALLTIEKHFQDLDHQIVGTDSKKAAQEVLDAAKMGMEVALQKLMLARDAAKAAQTLQSASMLEETEALVRKYAPKLAEQMGKGQMKSLLQSDPDLRETAGHIISAKGEADNYVLSSQMMGLFKRARPAMEKESVALLEESTKGKTPCILMLENYKGHDLVDLDKQAEFDGSWSSSRKDECDRRCLGVCKHGNSRYIIQRSELIVLGINPNSDAIQGDQVGAVCEGDGDCKCLDSTKSVHTVDELNRDEFGHDYRSSLFVENNDIKGHYIDVSEVFTEIPMPEDERDCMSQCPPTIHHKGATWRGLCFDEA